MGFGNLVDLKQKGSWKKWRELGCIRIREVSIFIFKTIISKSSPEYGERKEERFPVKIG